MWKWVKLALFLLIVGLCVLEPVSVSADTSEDVTVTAVGWIAAAPGGFTLTYINDHEVQITWTKGEDADNTMIRAKYGSYPSDKDDGYLVYYGDGESCSDTAVSLDETATAVHYRAWSENDGVFTEEYAEGTMEAISVTLIAFITLAALLTVVPLAFRLNPLLIVATFAWAGFGIYLMGEFASGSIQWVMAWVSLLAALFCAYEFIRRTLTDRVRPVDDEEEHRKAVHRIVRAGRKRRGGY